jgi:putative transposase
VVTLPPDRSFRRLVSQVLPLSPSAAAARRASQADRRTEAFGHAYAQRPGEIVMMDTTPLDVLAYDPVHDTNVRVELTLAICVASRCLLAWRFTPLGTKGIDIGLLLADVSA